MQAVFGLMKSVIALLRRESIFVLVIVISLLPALFLGAAADAASIHLFLSAQSLNGALPTPSQMAVDTFAGIHGFSLQVGLGFWLATVIVFIASAGGTPSSEAFRLRFLPGLILIWTCYLAYLSFVLCAWVLPKTPLFSRLDPANSWVESTVNIAMIAELLILVAVIVWFAVKKKS